jgi:hypothetical protein
VPAHIDNYELTAVWSANFLVTGRRCQASNVPRVTSRYTRAEGSRWVSRGSLGQVSTDEVWVTAQHRDFVAEDQGFEVLGRGAAGEQPEPAPRKRADTAVGTAQVAIMT